MYLKLSKMLEIISYKLRQKALYFELKHYIKTKAIYLKTINYYDRGIGKTYTLIQLAKKYKCPIFVPNNKVKNYVLGLSKNQINVIVCDERSRGLRFDLALCDEGIDSFKIDYILRPMCKNLVGYINNN